MIYFSLSESKAIAFIWAIITLCLSSVISERDVPSLHVPRSDEIIVKTPISKIDEVKGYSSLEWVKFAKKIGVIKPGNPKSFNNYKKSNTKDDNANKQTKKARIYRRSPWLNYPQSTKNTRSDENSEREKPLPDNRTPEEKARVSESNAKFFNNLLDKWTKEEDENIKNGKNNQATRYLLNLANEYRNSRSDTKENNQESSKTIPSDELKKLSELSNKQDYRRNVDPDAEMSPGTGGDNVAQSNIPTEVPEVTDQRIKDEDGKPIPEKIPNEPIPSVSNGDKLDEKPIENELNINGKLDTNSENSDEISRRSETSNGNIRKGESNRNVLSDPRGTFQCKSLKLRDTGIMTKVERALKLDPDTVPPLWALLRYAQRSGKVLPPAWIENPTIVQLAPPALVFFKEPAIEEGDLPSIAAIESVGESDICYSFFNPYTRGIDIKMTKAADVKVVVKSI